MAKIALVTDSTASIPEKYIQKYNITVLPQILNWGDESFRDGVDIQPLEFYTRLKNDKVSPKTSQVMPTEFKKAFEKLLNEGYEVLAIFVSSKLSGTLDSALQAKAMMPDAPIEIFDSLSVTMGLGFQVIEAGKAIEAGADMAGAAAAAESARERSGVLVTPETLEYLHRGGRVSNIKFLLSTALNIKPILYINEGRLEPMDRIRTRSKALQRLISATVEKANGKPVRIAAVHANAPEVAAELLAMAKAQMTVTEEFIIELSPVVGTHAGPGTAAIAYLIE